MGAILRLGFETGNNSQEADTGGFTAHYANTGWSKTHINGAGSWAFRCNPTDGTGNVGDALPAFITGAGFNGAGSAYGRFYAYFGTFPTAKEQFFAYRDQSNNGPSWNINNGTVTITNGAGGTTYPGTIVIPINTYIRYEWSHNFVGHLGTFSAAPVGVAGTTFGTMGTSSTNGTDISQFYVGYTTDTGHAGTFDVWYDDIAVNDSTGANQNGSLGEGYLAYYQPSVAGDNEQFTIQNGGVAGSQFNYTRVATMASSSLGTGTANGDNVTGHIDDFRISNTGNQIASNGTINCVRAVWQLGNGTAAGTNSLMVMRVKNVSGGTVLETGNINPTGGNFAGTLLSYTRPNGGGAWTQADCDTMQVGYRISSGSAFPSYAALLYVMIDYNGTAVPRNTTGGNKFLLGVGK